MSALPRGYRVKLFVFLSFALLAYATISTWKAKEEDAVFKKDFAEESIYQRKGKVVILLSNQRSGSSFVGEFFNRLERGFYLFEPLLPYTPSCEKLYDERLELLKKISHCDFRVLPSSYSYAYRTLKVKSHRECVTKNVCFINNHPTLLGRYAKLCSVIKQRFDGKANEETLRSAYSVMDSVLTSPPVPPLSGCQMPVNLTLWSSLCYSANLVAYKILRVCSLSALETIAKQLTEMGNEVYVVELVRDPRAIINSALKLELKPAALNERLNLLCGRFKQNLDYVQQQQTGSSTYGGLVASGRYMRIRYEDIASDPVGGATKIFNHLGMDLPKEIKAWIQETTISPDQTINDLETRLLNASLSLAEQEETRAKLSKLTSEKRSPYGTVRDSQQVLVKWRKQLTMRVIFEIQSQCGGVMERMGYKLINSEEERNDLSTQLW